MQFPYTDLFTKSACTDIVLHCDAADGKTTSIHYSKYVLACRFAYFTKLFATDTPVHEVNLNIDDITMSEIICNTYCQTYNGNNVNAESAKLKKLLMALRFLQIKEPVQLVVVPTVLQCVADIVFPDCCAYITPSCLELFAETVVEYKHLHFSLTKYIPAGTVFLIMLQYYVRQPDADVISMSNIALQKLHGTAFTNSSTKANFGAILLYTFMNHTSPEFFQMFSKAVLTEIIKPFNSKTF